MKNRPGGYEEEQYIEEYNDTVKNNSQIADGVLMTQVGTTGTIFRVNWDNVEYSCTSKEGFIGDKEYNLYPFMIKSEDAGDLFQGIVVFTNDENNHSLKIEALIPVSIKINDIFLPLNNIKSVGNSATLGYDEKYPNKFGNNVYFAIGNNNSSKTGVSGGKGCIIGTNNYISPYSTPFLIVGNNNTTQQVFAFAAIGDNLDVKNIYRGICLGKYNEVGTKQYYLVIGNGSSAKPRNALMVSLAGELIVPSSTSGSSKYFAITVDDTGAIKATEVEV